MHHGHRHGIESQLNNELTGADALTSTEQQSIQQTQASTKTAEQPTEQDLQKQKSQLHQDITSGNSAGVTADQTQILADQQTLSTDKATELQSIYGSLTPTQQQALSTELTSKQTKLNGETPQPGSREALELDHVNLQLAALQGAQSGTSGTSAAETSALQALGTDQGAQLTNRINEMEKRMAGNNGDPNLTAQQAALTLDANGNPIAPAVTTDGTLATTTSTPPVTSDAALLAQQQTQSNPANNATVPSDVASLLGGPTQLA